MPDYLLAGDSLCKKKSVSKEVNKKVEFSVALRKTMKLLRIIGLLKMKPSNSYVWETEKHKITNSRPHKEEREKPVE